MKTIIKTTMLLLLLGSSGVYGQRGIGTNSPNKDAVLELNSTTKGFLLPRLTTVQRDAIVSPVAGLAVYCTDCTPPGLSFYNGTSWEVLSFLSSGGVEMDAGTDGTLIWAKHNLGADQSLNPNTPSQGLHGYYYQWGEQAHTATSYSTDPVTWGPPTMATTGSWSLVTKGPNDPCPEGMRVPTKANWEKLFANNDISRVGPWSTATQEKYSSAVVLTHDGSTLTLPATGYIDRSNGAKAGVGEFAFYQITDRATGDENANSYYTSVVAGSSGANVYSTFFGPWSGPVRCVRE